MVLLEVGGSPYGIGQAVGREAAASIRAVLRDRAAWWNELRGFADAQPALVEKFMAAARYQTPDAFEELRGMADGSGLPMQQLLVLNLQAELGSMREERARSSGGESSPGCSTIVLLNRQRALLAHNEDGDKAYLDRMLLLKLRPTGHPAVHCACYPGLLPGNAPWVNDRGVVMTSNFIHSRKVKVGGVGRLFLHRQTMQAMDLPEAIVTTTHRERAYSYHCLLASMSNQRATSVEVTSERVSREDAAGLYLHTNHLVHQGMASEPQDPDYVGTSSMSRWNVLTEWKDSIEDLETLDADDLLSALSAHQGRPYSPCRHPEADVRGATVLATVFDLRAHQLRIYNGQPCRGRVEEFSVGQRM